MKFSKEWYLTQFAVVKRGGGESGRDENKSNNTKASNAVHFPRGETQLPSAPLNEIEVI